MTDKNTMLENSKLLRAALEDIAAHQGSLDCKVIASPRIGEEFELHFKVKDIVKAAIKKINELESN